MAAYIYIVTNTFNRVLYTGVTRDLKRRLHQHRSGTVPGFARTYRVWKLVYFEIHPTMMGAIKREKQIKAGSRAGKMARIEAVNPGWHDLSREL